MKRLFITQKGNIRVKSLPASIPAGERKSRYGFPNHDRCEGTFTSQPTIEYQHCGILARTDRDLLWNRGRVADRFSFLESPLDAILAVILSESITAKTTSPAGKFADDFIQRQLQKACVFITDFDFNGFCGLLPCINEGTDSKSLVKDGNEESMNGINNITVMDMVNGWLQ